MENSESLNNSGSLSRNVFYSMLLTGANYLFPLVVYIWISRVLGVAKVGLVGFVDSVTVYFILFSMMGISALGMRAVARARNNPRRLAESFWSLLVLHAIFTFAVLAVMIAATFLVDELYANRQFMYVGMCKLVFNVFLVEWLFTGLEKFRYITIRTLIVKGLYVISVFVFVRSPEDTFTYYVLTMLVVVVMAVVNMLYATHDVGIPGIRLQIRRFIKPFFTLGIYAVVTSSYATFNMAFLGFAADDTAVGYFSTASKIIALVSVVFTAFISVTAPRASRMWAVNDRIGFRRLANKSFHIVLILGVIAGLTVYIAAPLLVELLSGPGYEGAVTPLRIMAPFLVVIGISHMIALQVLVPSGREGLVTRYATVGFTVCLILDFLLAPHMMQNGTAIAWMAAESLTLLLAICNKSGRFFVNV